MKTDKPISKFLSFVLRHSPESIGIKLNDDGWVNLDILLRALKQSGKIVDRATILRVVEENDKKRFSLSGENHQMMIRAAQGHSVKVDLGYEEKQPPAVLFHGTATRNIDSIFKEGLKPGSRQKVHLSFDIETATKVGQRHGKVVVLKVQTQAAFQDGIKFFCADNGVWLTDHVPPCYLSI